MLIVFATWDGLERAVQNFVRNAQQANTRTSRGTQSAEFAPKDISRIRVHLRAPLVLLEDMHLIKVLLLAHWYLQEVFPLDL